MEITESTIYWITRLDAFRACAIALIIALGISILVCLFVVSCCDDIASFRVKGDVEKAIKTTRRAISCVFLSTLGIFACIIVLVFVPTSKDMALIKVIPAISNSKFVSDELPKNVKEIYELAKDAIKNRIGGNEK